MLIIIWVSLLNDDFIDYDDCIEIVEKGFSEFVWETNASVDLSLKVKRKIEAVKGCLRFADAFDEIFKDYSTNFTVHCERLARKLRVNMPKSY